MKKKTIYVSNALFLKSNIVIASSQVVSVQENSYSDCPKKLANMVCMDDVYNINICKNTRTCVNSIFSFYNTVCV